MTYGIVESNHKLPSRTLRVQVKKRLPSSDFEILNRPGSAKRNKDRECSWNEDKKQTKKTRHHDWSRLRRCGGDDRYFWTVGAHSPKRIFVLTIFESVRIRLRMYDEVRTSSAHQQNQTGWPTIAYESDQVHFQPIRLPRHWQLDLNSRFPGGRLVVVPSILATIRVVNSFDQT